MNNKLTYIELNPDSDSGTAKCMIWLHGLGADGNDFVSIAQELRLPSLSNIRYIFPNAPIMPVTINNGYMMPAWFDIQHPSISTAIDIAGIQKSVTSINSLIEQERKRGTDPANIILAGFSQGAVIALTTGILYPQRLGGVIALSGLLPNATAVIQQASPANRDIPIFIGHGSQDSVIPESMGKTTYDILTQASYPAKWHAYPMAHSVCAEEILDISRWVQEIWR